MNFSTTTQILWNHRRQVATATSLGLLMLGGCTSLQSSSNDTYGKTSPDGYNATLDTAGYRALQNGDYVYAEKYYEAANLETPGNPVYELNLAAAYQRQGRMTEAEPLLRLAVLNGEDTHPTVWTTDLAKDHNVAEVACQNLEMGLQPAIIAAKCQRLMTVAAVTPVYAVDAPERDTQTEMFVATAAPVATAPAAAPYVAPVAIFAAAKPAPRATTLGDIYFDFDKSTLTPQGHAMIANVATQLRGNEALQVTLVGKADHPGTDIYNMDLSDRRATAVRSALVDAGVSNLRIDATYVGERQAPVTTMEGTREQLNRVVEITVS